MYLTSVRSNPITRYFDNFIQRAQETRAWGMTQARLDLLPTLFHAPHCSLLCLLMRFRRSLFKRDRGYTDSPLLRVSLQLTSRSASAVISVSISCMVVISQSPPVRRCLPPKCVCVLPRISGHSASAIFFDIVPTCQGSGVT